MNMIRKVCRVLIYPAAVVSVLLAFAVFFLMTRSLKDGMDEAPSVTLNGPAQVLIGDTSYDNVSLADFSFDPVDSGTHISCSLTLPEDVISDPMLTIYIVHSRVRVFLDGENIYSYGQDKKRLCGYGHVSFPIKADYGGKELRIEMDVMEYGEVASIEPPVITGDSPYFFRNTLKKYRHQYFIDLTLILLGLSIAGVSFIIMLRDPEMVRLVFLATAVFGMGIWIFCNYDLIGLFTDNLALKGYLEYLSFYIAPFFFTLYFADDYLVRERTFRRYIYAVILAVQGFFIVDCIILHFTDIRHLPKSLPLNHVFLIVSLGFILYMSIRALIRKKHMHKPFLIGFILLVLFCARDMFYFIMYYYVGHNHGVRYESRMLSGIFMFAISMFLDFFSVQSRRRAAEARNEVLGRMAYTDTMTGLYNRRKSDEEFEILNSSYAGTDADAGHQNDPGRGERTVFGMISYDLNFLKKSNDIYGHEAGDKLLTDFAGLLNEIFDENCITCRMGGDEFLVIIPDENKVDTKSLIRQMQDRCDEINLTRTPLPLSYAYGYCQSTDPEVTGSEDIADAVYKCSDKRMYEHKAMMKRNNA